MLRLLGHFAGMDAEARHTNRRTWLKVLRGRRDRSMGEVRKYLEQMFRQVSKVECISSGIEEWFDAFCEEEA